jgi:hypothetical protein
MVSPLIYSSAHASVVGPYERPLRNRADNLRLHSSDYRFTVGHWHMELQAPALLFLVTSTSTGKLLKVQEFQADISAPSAYKRSDGCRC